jgi:hypothetical protein
VLVVNELNYCNYFLNYEVSCSQTLVIEAFFHVNRLSLPPFTSKHKRDTLAREFRSSGKWQWKAGWVFLGVWKELTTCILSNSGTWTVTLIVTQHHVPKYINPQENGCGNLKSCILKFSVSNNSLVYVPCIIRNSRNNQRYALICTTPLFYVLAPICYSSSLTSSGSFLDPSELLEIQIEWVVYRIMCCYTTYSICISSNSEGSHRSRNHTLCDIPPIQFVFQVTQKDLRSSLMMAGYCRNM